MQKIINFIQTLYNTQQFIPLHEPKFAGNEKKYLNECIDSSFVSSVGKFVERFEEEFAEFVGAKYAVATVNGTAALHASLVVAGVGAEDEVITQPLTFVATCNAIRYTGAKPVFVDVDRETMGMSSESLKEFLELHCEMDGKKCVNKQTQKTMKACVPMHTFGHPCKIDEIASICEEWGITLIEDAAESLGSWYNNKHTGTFGKMGAFSFNGNKIITSGGGGVVVTDDAKIAHKLKHLTTTAKIPHPYEYTHDMVGYNYRMPNINAALLVAQMEQLERFLEQKRALASKYAQFFESFDDIVFVEEPQGAKSNFWLNSIVMQNKEMRDSFLEQSNKNGVMTRPIWRLMSELEMFRECQKMELTNAKYLEERVVNLPSSVQG